MLSTRIAALFAAAALLASSSIADSRRAPSMLPQTKPDARTRQASLTIQTPALTMTGVRGAAVSNSLVLQTGGLTMTGMRGAVVSNSLVLQTSGLTMTGVRGAVAPSSIALTTAPLTMTGVRPQPLTDTGRKP